MPQREKKELRALLYLVQQGCCIWCGGMMNFNRRKSGAPAKDFPTLEHLERRADGGPLDLTNIVLAHSKCNTKRNIEQQAVATKRQRLNQQKLAE